MLQDEVLHGHVQGGVLQTDERWIPWSLMGHSETVAVDTSGGKDGGCWLIDPFPPWNGPSRAHQAGEIIAQIVAMARVKGTKPPWIRKQDMIEGNKTIVNEMPSEGRCGQKGATSDWKLNNEKRSLEPIWLQ